MSPARQTDADLDGLIEEITVDCSDEDEQLTGFEGAFDEDADFPCLPPSSEKQSRYYTSSKATADANSSPPVNATGAATRSHSSTSTSKPTQQPRGLELLVHPASPLG